MPSGDVRPTKEVVREALFSMLAERVPGARVLDLYAGSGVVGIEAWSRGAERVDWVEQHRGVFKTLTENVKTLCGQEAAAGCHMADVTAFLKRAPAGAWDLVLLDPPYTCYGEAETMPAVLKALRAPGLLAEDAIVVLEMGKKQRFDPGADWTLLRDRTYGDTRVLVMG